MLLLCLCCTFETTCVPLTHKRFPTHFGFQLHIRMSNARKAFHRRKRRDIIQFKAQMVEGCTLAKVAGKLPPVQRPSKKKGHSAALAAADAADDGSHARVRRVWLNEAGDRICFSWENGRRELDVDIPLIRLRRVEPLVSDGLFASSAPKGKIAPLELAALPRPVQAAVDGALKRAPAKPVDTNEGEARKLIEIQPGWCFVLWIDHKTDQKLPAAVVLQASSTKQRDFLIRGFKAEIPNVGPDQGILTSST